MLEQLLARIKEERLYDADQLARYEGGRLRSWERRDGKWVDISNEIADGLKRRIIEADAILWNAERNQS